MKQRKESWFILLPKKQNSLGTRAPYDISVNCGPMVPMVPVVPVDPVVPVVW